MHNITISEENLILHDYNLEKQPYGHLIASYIQPFIDFELYKRNIKIDDEYEPMSSYFTNLVLYEMKEYFIKKFGVVKLGTNSFDPLLVLYKMGPLDFSYEVKKFFESFDKMLKDYIALV